MNRSLNAVSQRRGRMISALVVAFITFLMFVPALRNGFVNRDDGLYIYQNPLITSINAAFFKSIFLDFHNANWHPFTWISHALDYAVWGLNPFGHHLTSIALHAANAALVTILVYALFDSRTSGTGEALPSFPTVRGLHVVAVSTALLFALHPLRVESVAWVSERKDVLCGFFYLLSLLAYLRHLRTVDACTGIRKFLSVPYLSSLALFVCALLSKPMAVTLPVTLLILDWYPARRIVSARTLLRAIVEKAPFFLLICGSAVLTYLAQAAGGTVVAMGDIPLASRLIVSAAGLVTYLREMIWPIGLSPFNAFPENVTATSPYFLSAIVIVVVITAASLFALRKSRLPLAVWGFYCITLLPVIGIVKVGLQATADRYTYLPCLGPSLLVGVILAFGYDRIGGARGARIALYAGALTVFCAMTAATVSQIGIWRDTAALWSRAIEQSAGDAAAAPGHRRVFVGLMYRNRAVGYMEKAAYGKAVEDLDRAIALYPDNADFYGNRGLANLRLGAYQKALADLSASLELDDRDPAVFANRAGVYRFQGKNDLALADLTSAITRDPSDVQLYRARAEVLYSLKEMSRAADDLGAVIRLDPGDAAAYYNRAHLRLQLGDLPSAAADLKRGCELGLDKACQEVGNAAGSKR